MKKICRKILLIFLSFLLKILKNSCENSRVKISKISKTSVQKSIYGKRWKTLKNQENNLWIPRKIFKKILENTIDRNLIPTHPQQKHRELSTNSQTRFFFADFKVNKITKKGNDFFPWILLIHFKSFSYYSFSFSILANGLVKEVYRAIKKYIKEKGKKYKKSEKEGKKMKNLNQFITEKKEKKWKTRKNEAEKNIFCF